MKFCTVGGKELRQYSLEENTHFSDSGALSLEGFFSQGSKLARRTVGKKGLSLPGPQQRDGHKEALPSTAAAALPADTSILYHKWP